MKTIGNIALLIFIIAALAKCTEPNSHSISKVSENDPFKTTVVESQFYTVEIEEPAVISGTKGTRIVILDGSLLDESGLPVAGSVDVELSEAYLLSDMLLSNLTTTSNGELLETDGMIYINFRQDGKELRINPDKPIYIEMPTNKKKDGMQVYSGLRDENGNMNWVNPKPLATFLVTVELEQLDFIPDGFSEKIEAGLPFRNHNTWSKQLEDSLFYSLASSALETPSSAYESALNGRDYEAINRTYIPAFDSRGDRIMEEACGINPASIGVLKSPEYQNTLIATREFEARLQSIYQSCDEEVLMKYVNNLDKDLWYCDSLAASIISKEEIKAIFLEYQKERLTNVADGAKYAAALQGFFDKEFRRILSNINAAKDSLTAATQLEIKAEEKVLEKYTKLLREREKQTMESYGFVRSESGWINIDRGIAEKDWELMELEVIVEAGSTFDRTHVYVIIPDRKSLHALYSADNQQFTVRINGANSLPMPKTGEAICIGIAYSENQPFFQIERIPIGSTKKLEMTLSEMESSKLTEILGELGEFNQENSIEHDLEYQSVLYDIQQRRKERENETNFILSLKGFHYSCCFKDGETLFALNCTPCHNAEPFDFSVYDYRTTEVSIYPYPLGGIKSIHDEEWFIRFNQNPQMFAKENEKAKEILDVFRVYGVHTSTAMNREELSIVYQYLGELSDENRLIQ